MRGGWDIAGDQAGQGGFGSVPIPNVSPAPGGQPAPQPAQQPWGGWNQQNAFSYGADLNPLSQATGVARDDLATSRDAFFAPHMEQFRSQYGVGGGPSGAAADDAGLMADPRFRSYVETGQFAPTNPNATASQSWNDPTIQGQVRTAAQVNEGRDSARNDTLWKSLMSEIGNVDNVDPSLISRERDAYAANEERSKRDYLADLAESSGPTANLRGETRLAAERVGQRTGAFEAQLRARELASNRDRAGRALQLASGQLSGDQNLQLQRELGLMNQSLGERGLDLQGRGMDDAMSRALMQDDQFYSQLGLNAEDRAAYWDSVRRGL
jgi:hypothetical protein